MPPDLALLTILIGSNYPCLELVFMVPKVLEPLKFDSVYEKNLFSCLDTITKSFLMKTRYPGRLGIDEFTRVGFFGLVC